MSRSDSPPCFRILERRAPAPLLLTCEHATRRLPADLGRPSPAERAVLATHWGWDLGAWDLTRGLSRRLGAPAIGGRWTRLLIDLNRRVDDPTLVRPRAAGVPLGWNAGLTPARLEQRIARYHTPYHNEIDRMLAGRLVRGVRPLIFAVHSFTSSYRGRDRRFEVGVLYERSPELAYQLGRALRASGLDVRYNQPYSGRKGLMYAADRHGSHFGLPCLELEFNQDLFRGARRAARLERTVAAALGGILERLP